MESFTLKSIDGATTPEVPDRTSFSGFTVPKGASSDMPHACFTTQLGLRKFGFEMCECECVGDVSGGD